MEKKLDLKRISELKTIFKKIHTENSFHHSFSGGVYYYEISQTDNYREEDDKIFMEEIKPILLSIRKEFDKDDKDKPLSDKGSFLSYKDYHGSLIKLNLEEYLKIVEKSDSYFVYLLELFEKGHKYFNSKDLNWFSNKYIFNDFIGLEVVIDIKEIRVKRPYAYIKETKFFDETDNNWKIKEYEKVFGDVYKIMPKLLNHYLEGKAYDKKTDFPEFLTDVLKETITDHNIPHLADKLKEMVEKFNSIIKDLFDIRSMLGKEQGKSKHNEEWVNAFEDATKINQKVCSRITIDLLKTIHNAIMISGVKKIPEETVK